MKSYLNGPKDDPKFQQGVSSCELKRELKRNCLFIVFFQSSPEDALRWGHSRRLLQEQDQRGSHGETAVSRTIVFHQFFCLFKRGRPFTGKDVYFGHCNNIYLAGVHFYLFIKDYFHLLESRQVFFFVIFLIKSISKRREVGINRAIKNTNKSPKIIAKKSNK